jgi:hypothetical protein
VKGLTEMLLSITSFEITHQQGVPSLYSVVDVIDQLLPVHPARAFEQIAATADDRHDVCQLVTQICRPQCV